MSHEKENSLSRAFFKCYNSKKKDNHMKGGKRGIKGRKIFDQ